MTGPRSTRPLGFDPDELGTNDPTDLADALESATWLEASIEDVAVRTGPQFTNRVMAALADEPAPAFAGFLAPLRRLGPVAGFGASVRQAWASIAAPNRPGLVRATALAYILVIAIAGTSLAGAATIGFAGALGIFRPSATGASPSIAPFGPTEPGRTELPSAETEPSGPEASDEPGGSPGASDDSGGSGVPDSSDDHGDGSLSGSTSATGSTGSTGSDDGSGSGDPTASPTNTSTSGSDGGDNSTSTPRPSQTPRPTGTPNATQTSGSGSGSASDN